MPWSKNAIICHELPVKSSENRKREYNYIVYCNEFKSVEYFFSFDKQTARNSLSRCYIAVGIRLSGFWIVCHLVVLTTCSELDL
jgi:hypothetical protein